jgi:hypothetical protein
MMKGAALPVNGIGFAAIATRLHEQRRATKRKKAGLERARLKVLAT